MASVFHRRLDLSGRLGFTGRHFAQVIEGWSEHVQQLMRLVQQDHRYTGLRVLGDEPILTRRYADWHVVTVREPGLDDELAALLRAQDLMAGRYRHAAERLWRLLDASPMEPQSPV